jgi:thiazole synthase
LLVGIELYTSPEVIGRVLKASHADVFITTYDLEQTRSSMLLTDLDEHLDLDSYLWIGTTSFARSVADAVTTSLRLRDSMGLDIIKLDVRDDTNSPCAKSTLEAAAKLLAEGFALLPLIQPDVRIATQLEEMGCSAVRLLASPVGSYQGIANAATAKECLAELTVPAVLEGGIGSPADVVRAMELGASAVLVNTLIARSGDPGSMARAVYHAAIAGGMAARAGSVAEASR